MSCATRRKIFTEIFYCVSKEWARSWSHTFLVTNLNVLFQKLSTVHPKSLTRRRKRITKQQKKTISEGIKRLLAEPTPVSEPRISRDHAIKGLCDIIGVSPSWEVIILLSLVAIGTLVIAMKWFLILFLMSFDNIKLHHHPSKLGGHRHCGCGGIMVLVCHMIFHDHVIRA